MPFPKRSSSTPAAQLHAAYNRVTAGQSDFRKWKEIAKRYTVAQGMLVIRYVEGNYSVYPSMSLQTFANLLKQAESDPVASGYPVSQEALAVTLGLVDKGCDIPAEYVAQAIDRYREFARQVEQERQVLWWVMPPASLFVVMWFTEIADFGSPRIRQFHTKHPKFRNWLASTSRVHTGQGIEGLV